MIRYDRKRKNKDKGKVMMERSIIEESKDDRMKEKEKKKRKMI